jgi:erythromycin esterase-like protein
MKFMHFNHQELIQTIQQRAVPLQQRLDLRALIDHIGQARIVMLGESSHGTQEFYEWRRLISQWLIAKHGFRFIAVEGDWPPCWEVDQYIHSNSKENAREILERFDRWPTWMWSNTEVIRLVEWLRTHNSITLDQEKVGFFGLDVYSLFESIDATLKQLETINPFLARKARNRYSCFDPYHRNEKAYAKSLMEFPEGCEKKVLENLQELLQIRLNGLQQEEMLLNIVQNARVVLGAEHYYRAMIHGTEDSWNIRDGHMIDTLEHLLNYYGPDSKAIVWAHNTHIGDFRATDMINAGNVNIGGLARQKWGPEQVSLVGFGTNEGEVIASHSWDGPIEKMKVPPGKPGSYEAAFHSVAKTLKQNAFYICFDNPNDTRGALSETLGHRAIGVVYQPSFERFGNYVPTSLANRYDAFLFVDRTSALEPLIQSFHSEEIPETWPKGL